MVAANIKRTRIEAGLSQAELATKLGADRSYVSGLELGKRNPTVVTLWHVATALGVPIGSFFARPRGRRAK